MQQLLFTRVWLSGETSKHCGHKQQQGQTALENNIVMSAAILIEPRSDEGKIADHTLTKKALALDFHENDFLPEPV